MARKVLIYTFYNPRHITYKILQEINIPNVQKFYLGKLEDLVGLIKEEHFDYILGLGDFRKNGKFIRIERVFKNRYGKREISETGLESYESTWKLPVQERVALSSNAANGPCNRSAYLISQTIKKNNLKSKLAFIHIPSKTELQIIEKVITEWIR